MRSLDVNVLIHALRADSADHERIAGWLEAVMRSGETVGLSSSVLTGFIRIVTNPRVFVTPTPLTRAFRQLDGLLTQPQVSLLHPGPRHWEIFSDVCQAADAGGNLVSDAAHAALAIEHGATWVTLDRDFARFPGLRWELPHLAE